MTSAETKYSDRRFGRFGIMRPAAVGALVHIGSVACAPITRVPRTTPAASDAYVQSQRRLAAVGHARLQAALDAQDTAAVAASLASDVQVLTPRGDTASGAMVLTYLMFLAADRTTPLRLKPGRLEPCLTGDVYEYAGDLAAPVRSGVYATGSYAILWSVDAQPAVVRQLVLSMDRKTPGGGVQCNLEYKWAASQRQWTATFTAELSPTTSYAARDVHRAMQNQGLAFAVVVANTGVAEQPFPQIEHRRGGATVGLRRRIDPRRSVELQLGARFPETVTGYDDATGRYISAAGFPIILSTLAQYQRGSMRLGLGPAIQFANWRVTEDERTLSVRTITSRQLNPYTGRPENRSTTYTTWDTVAGSSRSTSHGLAPALGLAADVAMMRPLSRHLIAEFHVSAAAFTNSTLPDTPGFRDAKAADRVLRLGVSLARGW